MKDIKEIARYFKKVKYNGRNSFNCLCPIHEDKNPSLSVTEKDGKILLCCHAGCNTRDIINAVGLNFNDLGSITHEDKDPIIKYHYYDFNGKYWYTKTRESATKTIRYAVYEGDKMIECKKPDNTPSLLYNYKALERACKEQTYIYFVEGEKDVETLKRKGLNAVTCGGAKDWKKEIAKHFIGMNVVILPDNDKAGKDLAREVLRDIKPYAYSIKIVKTSDKEKGDITDFFEDGHSLDELYNLIKETEPQYGNFLYKKGAEYKVNYDILSDTIIKLYNVIEVKELETTGATYYYYDGTTYKILTDEKLTKLIRQFSPIGTATYKAIKETKELVKISARSVRNDELEQVQDYINFLNGIYKISDKKLISHTPDIITLTQIKASYNADLVKSNMRDLTFTNFISTLCSDNDGIKIDMVKTLQEYIGLIISNIHCYKIKGSLLLYSPEGNTGKSQFFNLISRLLGNENIAIADIQDLADRWTTASMYGKRLVYTGDLKHTPIKDASIYKALTGGDIIRAERKGKDPFEFKFTGLIGASSNHLPTFKSEKGNHNIERFNIYKCETVIDKDKRDPDIVEKMLKEKEYIICFALQGLHRLIDNNFHLTAKESPEGIVDEYRADTDTLYKFIREKCSKIDGQRVSTSTFYRAYEIACREWDLTPVSKRGYVERLSSYGFKKVKSNGVYYINNLHID